MTEYEHIHLVPGRGGTFHLWGMDCIRVELGDHVHRIGSNDVFNLHSFLQSRIQSKARESASAR